MSVKVGRISRAPYASLRKIDLEKVQASLDKTCPKCGFRITPDLVRRLDFERMEGPKCGERFRPKVALQKFT